MIFQSLTADGSLTWLRRIPCELRAAVDRILAVDDEKSIVFALREYFFRHGFLVDCATTAEQALELLATNHYAVAIVDIDLRGSRAFDGLNLAHFIRLHSPATAVIILSAVESNEAEGRARDAGVHSFIHKPTPLAQLADVAFGLMRDAVSE